MTSQFRHKFRQIFLDFQLRSNQHIGVEVEAENLLGGSFHLVSGL